MSAWRTVAEAVTDPSVPIPASSGAFAIALGCVAAAQVFLEHAYLRDDDDDDDAAGSTGGRRRARYRAWLPNWMAVGVAFVIPQTYYSTATLVGAVTAEVWQRRGRRSFDAYAFAIAAGLMAGEGLGGVVGAVLELAGVGGGDVRVAGRVSDEQVLDAVDMPPDRECSFSQ